MPIARLKAFTHPQDVRPDQGCRTTTEYSTTEPRPDQKHDEVVIHARFISEKNILIKAWYNMQKDHREGGLFSPKNLIVSQFINNSHVLNFL